MPTLLRFWFTLNSLWITKSNNRRLLMKQQKAKTIPTQADGKNVLHLNDGMKRATNHRKRFSWNNNVVHICSKFLWQTTNLIFGRKTGTLRTRHSWDKNGLHLQKYSELWKRSVRPHPEFSSSQLLTAKERYSVETLS